MRATSVIRSINAERERERERKRGRANGSEQFPYNKLNASPEEISRETA